MLLSDSLFSHFPFNVTEISKSGGSEDMNRTQQIIAMMILWAVALIGYDNFTKPPSKASTVTSGVAPQIVTTFTHFCCSGCYDKMFSAAKHMSWIVNASVSDILPK